MDRDSQPKDKLSNDIRDWSFQVGEDKLVIFEEYKNTLERSRLETRNSEEEEEEDEDEYEANVKMREFAVYHSPIGPVILPELTDPTKHFKLWTLYSKVPLTKTLLIKIEETKGVETIEALSRYRARVGIAPLFADRPILNNITQIIQDSTLFDIKNIPNIS